MTRRHTPFPDSPALVRYGLPSLERGASPAAAADFVQAVEGNYFVRLLSLHVRFVTDANVADRELCLEFRDEGDNRYDLSGAPVEQTASTTTDYIFSVFQGQAEWPVDSSVLVPLHERILPPTHDFRVHIVNAQAGDQLSRIRFVWERFYTHDEPVTADFLAAEVVR
jgi:hypothetical protein